MSKEIVGAIQNIRGKLRGELSKPDLSLDTQVRLRTATKDLDAAEVRILSLAQCNWKTPALAQHTKQINELSTSLLNVENTTQVLGVMSQMISLVSFVLAHVEPDEPWPKK